MPLKRTRPATLLLLELENVARSAFELEQAIEGVNFLPDEFPKETLLEIAWTLKKVAHGTSEGCRIPLEYARHKLPSIRRLHVRESTNSNSALTELPEHVIRDETIDVHLQKLITNVVTALDAYRHLAHSNEDLVEIDDSKEVQHYSPATNIVRETAHEIVQQSEQFSNVSNSVDLSESSEGERLSRLISDTSVYAKVTTVELSSDKASPRWLRTIGTALKNYPRTIRKAGKLIITGTHIAEIYFDVWSDFWSSFEKQIFSSVKKLGESTIEVGNYLEDQKFPQPQKSEPDTGDPVTKNWLRQFVFQRDQGDGVALSLIASAIQFHAGISPKEIAKKLGQKNLSSLLESIDGISVIGNSTSKAFISNNINTEQFYRKYLAYCLNDIDRAYQHTTKTKPEATINEIKVELNRDFNARSNLNILKHISGEKISDVIKKNYNLDIPLNSALDDKTKLDDKFIRIRRKAT